MSFRRGVGLTVADTLGHAATSSLGLLTHPDAAPADSGFSSTWPDDLALLADVGVTDVRLTFDWARLQERPGDLAGEWTEWYGNVIDAARAIGVSIWACLLDLDRAIPRWLDNEGGLDDVDTLVRWWPRWLERIADEFGDRIDGWIPAARTSPDLPTAAWNDTWGLLRGEAPVALSLGHDDLNRADELRGLYDLIGVAIDVSDHVSDADSAERLHVVGERWADQIGRATEISERRPIVSDLTLETADPDLAAPLLARLVEVVEPADASGEHPATVDRTFVGPMVAIDERPGLFEPDRSERPEGATYLRLPIS